MPLISDLLTGKFFRFRLASGADVLVGTSQKHLVTPKSLLDAGLVPPSSGGSAGASIPFVLNQQVVANFTSFSAGSHYGILPAAPSPLSARLYAYCNADPGGAAGEVCLWDVAANSMVSGSVITVNAVPLTLYQSAVFNVAPGKVYTYALRRTNTLATFIYLRSALLVIV
jgi:hypothetical protein